MSKDFDFTEFDFNELNKLLDESLKKPSPAPDPQPEVYEEPTEEEIRQVEQLEKEDAHNAQVAFNAIAALSGDDDVLEPPVPVAPMQDFDRIPIVDHTAPFSIPEEKRKKRPRRRWAIPSRSMLRPLNRPMPSPRNCHPKQTNGLNLPDTSARLSAAVSLSA